jgi:hypothetical protein
LRHRSATPLGAVDSGDVTWTISGRGNSDANPRILGRSLWVVVDCFSGAVASVFVGPRG